MWDDDTAARHTKTDVLHIQFQCQVDWCYTSIDLYNRADGLV